jgi:DNA-binding protein HU-beta
MEADVTVVGLLDVARAGDPGVVTTSWSACRGDADRVAASPVVEVGRGDSAPDDSTLASLEFSRRRHPQEIRAMAVITRDVLAERLADWVESNEGQMSLEAARDEVRWFFDTLTTSLVNGDEVRIHGFGTLKTAERAARMGRNPRTGESVKVAARRVARFTPGTTLATTLKETKVPGKRGRAKKA